MSDLSFGIIGLNEGNGHPFSYAAIFNGYDPFSLEKDCPFDLIKEYLPKEHRNEVFIDGAKVTHIYTQDFKLSKAVSKVSKIPEIVNNPKDMIGVVDAIILARDDPENHLKYAKPFLEAGLPIFIDKQLADTVDDCREILRYTDEDYPIMAGSGARYSNNVIRAGKTLNDLTVISVHGMCRVNWIRYGHHVFEPIARLFGLDIINVRSLESIDGHDIVQIKYASGMNVILEFIENIHLPIQFTCFSLEKEPLVVCFDDFFHSYRELLKSFTSLVSEGTKPFPYREMVDIARVVLAGHLSKKNNSAWVDPFSLNINA